MEKATRIFGDIDFERTGRQIGHLYLPYSVTRSAYGNIALPIAVIAGGKGPTVFLQAGTHGDEYEGQIALTKLIRALEPGDDRFATAGSRDRAMRQVPLCAARSVSSVHRKGGLYVPQVPWVCAGLDGELGEARRHLQQGGSQSLLDGGLRRAEELVGLLDIDGNGIGFHFSGISPGYLTSG